MRRSLFSLSVWAVAALTLISCAKEKEADSLSPKADGGIPFEIVASVPATKTENDNLSTKWASGDAVNVFHAVAGTAEYINDGEFTISDVENGIFNGMLASALDPAQSYDWYVYYPYNSNITTPENTSGGYSTVAGITQVQKKNPKGKEHLAQFPLAGKCTTAEGVSNPTVSMKLLSAVIQVTVTNNFGSYLPLSEVIFTAPVNVSGDYFVNFTNPDNPVYTEKAERVGQTVTLATSVFIKNSTKETFYFLVKPFTLAASSTLKVAVNGYEKSIVLDSDKEFLAGTIYPFTFNYDDTGVKKKVVCWGDSYMSEDYGTFCKYLQALLGYEWQVFNGGKSGFRTYEIAARQGAVPIVTGSEFILPAKTGNTAEPFMNVECFYRTHNVMGETGYYKIRHFSGPFVNPCTLLDENGNRLTDSNGETIFCNVMSTNTDPDDKSTYYAKIQRITKGPAVTIPAHTRIESYGARELRDADVTIIYMGANGMFGSENNRTPSMDGALENLIDQHWEMINYATHSDSCLVLGFHNHTSWKNYGYGPLFESAFGDKFLYLREAVVGTESQSAEERTNNLINWLLYSGAYENASDVPQSEITRCVVDGDWPLTFNHKPNDSHPNEYGGKVIAKLIYDRMVALGYVTSGTGD